jgi:hypothetical protein
MRNVRSFNQFKLNESDEKDDLYSKVRSIIQTISSPNGFYYLVGVDKAAAKITQLADQMGYNVDYVRVEKILNSSIKKENKDSYTIVGKDLAASQITALITGEGVEERPNKFNDISDLKPGRMLQDEPESIKQSIRQRNQEIERGRLDHFGSIDRDRDRGSDTRFW